VGCGCRSWGGGAHPDQQLSSTRLANCDRPPPRPIRSFQPPALSTVTLNRLCRWDMRDRRGVVQVSARWGCIGVASASYWRRIGVALQWALFQEGLSRGSSASAVWCLLSADSTPCSCSRSKHSSKTLCCLHYTTLNYTQNTPQHPNPNPGVPRAGLEGRQGLCARHQLQLHGHQVRGGGGGGAGLEADCAARLILPARLLASCPPK